MSTRREFVRTMLVGAAATLLLPTAADAAGATKAPPGTIDWHNHWISKGAVRLLSQRSPVPIIETNEDGVSAFVGTLPAPRPLAVEFTDIDARLRHIDAAGVNRQVISWPTTLGADALLGAADAKELWTVYNDELADVVRGHPSRFSGLAALATSDVEWSAGELERAHRQLGLIGAVLPVEAFQTIDGARKLAPIFEVAQKHGSHIYLHAGAAIPPIPGQIQGRFASNDAPVIRASLETASTFEEAAVVLGQSDFLDSYPDVTVQVAMLGGLAAFLAAHGSSAAPRPGAYGDNTARRGFGRLYFDTGVYGRSRALVGFAVGALGAEHILFGSNYPLASTHKTIAAIDSTSLDSDSKNRLFVSNGAGLFGAKGGHAG